MRKIYLPSSLACLLFFFLLLPVVKAGSSVNSNKYFNAVNKEESQTVPEAKPSNEEPAVETTATTIYDSLDLKNIGLSKEAMLYAYKGMQNMLKKGMVTNDEILTVCDFSQSSNRRRMYIIDVKNFKVLVNTYVAHGKNSGLKYAERFSNRHRSLQSSLGFYVTKHTYYGQHGLSLRLSGKDKGYNDNAESRAIVLHGATYIGPHKAKARYQGRSFGCPAVPQQLSKKVINIIKDGSCLFIYHPSKSYLHGSRILNG